MNITDIDRVYVINLDRRPDRWERVQRDWAETGVPIPLTRWPACDGRDFRPPASWDVGRAAYGCWLSHLSILIDMVRTCLDNVLILEDDAVFADGFADKLAGVLDDMPSRYDQLYLGYQLLHTERVPPSRITEHLGRAGNCNRSHAILYSGDGAERILTEVMDLSNRQHREHIDHWLGRAIHEPLDNNGEHRYDVYIAIPQLVYQNDGASDISGKTNQVNKWLYNGRYLREYKPLVEVTSYTTAFGQVGRHGRLGYEGRMADIADDERTTVISLHAPSTLFLRVKDPVYVTGCMNSSGSAREPVRVFVDGVAAGTVQSAGDRGESHLLEPGEHCLEFRIDQNQNAFAHTFWVFRKP